MATLSVELDEALAAALAARARTSGVDPRQLAADLLVNALGGDAAAAAGQPLWSARFLSAVVHEVRTPLSSLLLTAELLAEDPRLDPRQARFASTLYESAADLRALVDDLGELNRVRGGRARVLVATVPLADLFAELEESLRERVSDRGAAWQVTAAPGAPAELVSDVSWLHRIGEQMAASALAAGAQRLDWRVAAAGGGVALVLEDDGERLPAEELAKLFEPFASAAARVRRSHGGSGLGLALAAAAARLLGGTLAASSEERGTTLTLRLPLVASASEPPAVGG